MTRDKLNLGGGIAFALLGTGLGLVAYSYGTAMSSAHSMEPGLAYTLIGYGCGLVGALIGVAKSKLFHTRR